MPRTTRTTKQARTRTTTPAAKVAETVSATEVLANVPALMEAMLPETETTVETPETVETVETPETPETASTTPETTGDEAASFDPTATFTDDSRVNDPESFPTLMEAVGKAGLVAYNAEQRAVKTKVLLAAAIIVMRLAIIRKDDRPDWEGETLAAKDATRDAMTETRDKMGKVAYRTFMASLRKHYPAALLPVIVRHVVETENGFPAEREFVFVKTPAADGNEAVLHDEAGIRKQLDLLIAGPSALLIAAVRKHYNEAGLGVPKRYNGAECRFWLKSEDAPETGGGPAKDDPPSPAETVMKGVAGLADVNVPIQSAALLQAASLIVVAMTHPKHGAIDDSGQVASDLNRVTILANLGAKFAHDRAKFTEQDREAVVNAAWKQADQDRTK